MIGIMAQSTRELREMDGQRAESEAHYFGAETALSLYAGRLARRTVWCEELTASMKRALAEVNISLGRTA